MFLVSCINRDISRNESRLKNGHMTGWGEGPCSECIVRDTYFRIRSLGLNCMCFLLPFALRIFGHLLLVY